jgi:AraC-like DNA-binding protein
LKPQNENNLTVKFYKPDNSVEWIVKQYESIRYCGSKQLLTDKFIPRPDAALVFHFKNIPRILAPVQVKLKPFFVAPVVSFPNQLHMEGPMDGFIVVCKASVLSRVFELNMLEKPQLIVDLPDEVFAPLFEILRDAKTDESRIECISRFIQNKAGIHYQYDIIDTIYDKIVANISDLTLEDIQKPALQSLSATQRNFNKRVGVSMKKLMRISRVNCIFNNMISDSSFNAQKMMFEGNYYDQPHFIKDFKELTGETPKQFFKHNTELCRIISGIFNVDLSFS